jgi:hypothetical protein
MPTTRAEVDGGDVPEVAVAVVDARPDGPARHLRYGVVDGCPCPFPLVVCHRPRLLCQRRQTTKAAISTMIAMIASNHRSRRTFTSAPLIRTGTYASCQPNVAGVAPQDAFQLLKSQATTPTPPGVRLGPDEELQTQPSVQRGEPMRDIHAGWRDRDVAIRPATGFYVVHRVQSSGLRTPGARSRWLSRRPLDPTPQAGRETGYRSAPYSR